MDARMQARRALELDLRRRWSSRRVRALLPAGARTCERTAISGFEALLRWHHPERGLVLPGEFIPLAEEIGLIVPLGDWVLRQACADAAAWPGDVKVAVNLSPVAVPQRDGWLEIGDQALAASRLAPQRLELEITEGVLLDRARDHARHAASAARARRPHRHGRFRHRLFALSYLRSFPFDKIKIDRSFIRDLSDRRRARWRSSAPSPASARSLGMTTTAEGVETSEQLERVRAEGCTEVQGFLFSQPRPAGEIGGLLAACPGEPVAAA